MYSHLVWCMHVFVCGLMQNPCVYCVCLARWVSFSTRAPVQSLITADLQILSLNSVDNSRHQRSVLILPNGLCKPREQAHDRNTFLPWVGFEPTTSWSTVQRLTAELSPPAIYRSICFTCHRCTITVSDMNRIYVIFAIQGHGYVLEWNLSLAT